MEYRYARDTFTSRGACSLAVMMLSNRTESCIEHGAGAQKRMASSLALRLHASPSSQRINQAVGSTCALSSALPPVGDSHGGHHQVSATNGTRAFQADV
jgi:hypothetical protein